MIDQKIDWASSGRRTTYSYHLVDPFSLAETGEQLEVLQDSGSVTYALDSENIYSAQIKAVNTTNRDRMVRIKQHIQIPLGLVNGTMQYEWATDVLGTFFVDDVPCNAKYGKVERTLNMYSCLYRHTQDILMYDFARPKGYNVVQEIRELVEADGGHLVVRSDVDSTRKHTLKDGIRFELSKNKGEVLRTIAGWIDARISADGWGSVVLEAATPAAQVAPSYTFRAGSNCVYLPGVDFNNNSKDAVNRVHAYYSSSDNSVAVLVDLPETHPFSFQRIGRHMTYDMRIDEEMSEAQLQQKAKQYLDEHCGSKDSYEIQHVSIPGLRVGQTVRYINNTDFEQPVNVVCQVTEIAMSLTPAALCKTKLVEV